MAITTRKQTAVFQKEALDTIERLGFIKTPASRYDYRLETIAGPLDLSIHDSWLACCFDNVVLAVKHVGGLRLNHFSGKWNWMEMTELQAFEAAVNRIRLAEAAA